MLVLASALALVLVPGCRAIVGPRGAVEAVPMGIYIVRPFNYKTQNGNIILQAMGVHVRMCMCTCVFMVHVHVCGTSYGP